MDAAETQKQATIKVEHYWYPVEHVHIHYHWAIISNSL